MGISVNPTALYNSTFMLPCFICKGGILCLGRVVDRHNRRDIYIYITIHCILSHDLYGSNSHGRISLQPVSL